MRQHFISVLPCDPSPPRLSGAEEGVRTHQVPGASQSKGPGLRHPSEGPHRLGAHDRHALLHRTGLPAPEGHMVSTFYAPFVRRPMRRGIKPFQFPDEKEKWRALPFEFSFTCRKRAERSPVQANIWLQFIIWKKDNCGCNGFVFFPSTLRLCAFLTSNWYGM